MIPGFVGFANGLDPAVSASCFCKVSTTRLRLAIASTSLSILPSFSEGDFAKSTGGTLGVAGCLKNDDQTPRSFDQTSPYQECDLGALDTTALYSRYHPPSTSNCFEPQNRMPYDEDDFRAPRPIRGPAAVY